ncbi:ATP-binding cassette domain-containing protein [Rhodococcus sp. BP-241]|uniref:ATP-binding cassette domain-containing protein n=1 Tax=Rhodococcus sp. BP-241 TaxID=2739441 RepID=UPI0027DEBCCD|nr:ATP-binding cassette domain-containing protein [Rhodococcus sp. BP-241]
MENRRIDKLSGGQRRRVDVAVGVIGRPEVLFLDEPTSSFDPEVKLAFGQLIEDLAPGTTVILATHDLAEAQRLADRIIMLAGGRVVAHGTSEELRNKCARRSGALDRRRGGTRIDRRRRSAVRSRPAHRSRPAPCHRSGSHARVARKS